MTVATTQSPTPEGLKYIPEPRTDFYACIYMDLDWLYPAPRWVMLCRKSWLCLPGCSVDFIIAGITPIGVIYKTHGSIRINLHLAELFTIFIRMFNFVSQQKVNSIIKPKSFAQYIPCLIIYYI
jgi:hypothetical protein